MRTSWRTFIESARSSLLAPAAGTPDVILRTALFVVVIVGAIGLGGRRSRPGPSTG